MLRHLKVRHKKGGIQLAQPTKIIEKIGCCFEQTNPRSRMNKKKILFVINSCAGGGTESQLLKLIKEIRLSYNIMLITLLEDDSLFSEFEETTIIIKKINFLKSPILSFFKLRKIIAAFSPHIVHAWLPYSVVIVNLALLVFKINTYSIASYRNSISRNKIKRNFLRNLLEYIALKRSDSIVVNSNGVKKSILKLYPSFFGKIIIIENGYSLERIEYRENAKKTLRIKKDDKIFITVGRLEKQKNIFLMLRSFKIVLKSISAKYIILGKGSLFLKIENYIKKNNLQNFVYLLGYKKDIRPYLNIADMLLNSSYYEGLPNVILESFAHEVPVIASDVEGNNDIIENNVTGLLFHVSDHEQMAGKIVNLLSKRELYDAIASNAHDKYLNNYTLDKMVGNYKYLYENSN